MSEKAHRPDPRRRPHLGIKRTELTGRSFERFFRWELDPLPQEVEDAVARGEADPGEALPLAEVNRLLEPGYLPLETGYATLPDGTVQVAALTRFPGASAAMIDWWFGWHGDESDRYKLWHPQAHLYTQWRYLRSGVSGREKYVGNVSYVDEYIGRAINRLAIAFKPPHELGLDEDAFEKAGVGTAVCARTGLGTSPIEGGSLIHLIRETDDGCEMRSRFWIGRPHVAGLAEGNPLDRLLQSPFVRGRILPKRLGHDLLIHCAEEMNHLASFLPALYAQETSAS